MNSVPPSFANFLFANSGFSQKSASLDFERFTLTQDYAKCPLGVSFSILSFRGFYKFKEIIEIIFWKSPPNLSEEDFKFVPIDSIIALLCYVLDYLCILWSFSSYFVKGSNWGNEGKVKTELNQGN